MVLHIQVRMTFYFKASDLGEYILFDQDSKYLTYNTFNAIVRNTTLSDRTRFKVEQYEDNSFSFYSYVKRNMLELRELHWFGKIMWMKHAGLNWNLQKEIIRSRKQM